MILADRYGLSMFGDLKNPVMTNAVATPGLFRKAGPGDGDIQAGHGVGLATRLAGGGRA